MIKLSIITPYYQCLSEIKNLAAALTSQLTEEIEWIIIDDGCHEKELDDFNAIVIHLNKNSGCAGIPRNYGLDIAKGEYITFIDADDLISECFIQKTLEKINTSIFDYCFMSWTKPDHSLYVDITQGRPEWNCSVWAILYKKENINNIRFNNKRIAEDYDFNAQALKGKKEIIPEYLYIYNSNANGISATWKGDEN